MDTNEREIREYQRQIDRLKSTQKGMKIGGIISTILGAVMFVGGIIFYVVSIVQTAMSASSTESDPASVVGDVFSIVGGALIFIFGILLLVTGISLLVIQRVVFARKINNRERRIDELQDYPQDYQSDK